MKIMVKQSLGLKIQSRAERLINLNLGKMGGLSPN